MKIHKKHTLVILALACSSPVNASNVAWGGSGSFNPIAFDSYGNIDDDVMVWEIGWFNDGYTPDATNYTSWADNWNSVDVGSHYLYGDGTWNTNEISATNPPSSISKTVYMFVHNGGTDPTVWGALMGTPDGEALLMTQYQTFQAAPSPAITFDIADNPFDTDDDNFNVIWGRVDRNMYKDSLWPGDPSLLPANGGVIWNAGIISNLIPDSQADPYDDFNGTFENQTATWAAVIPEPSSVLAGLLLAAGLLRRQRN